MAGDTTKRRSRKRSPLTRDKVLETALRLADTGGIGSLSMRKLAEALGVEAMSLYHHVRNKDAILDGMVDAVFSEIEVPGDEPDWRVAMRRRASSAREALNRHPWALGLMDSRRSPGAATLEHHDAVIGVLRRAGFPIAMVAHAYSALDSYIYGFCLQEQSLPFHSAEELEEVAEALLASMPKEVYPHLVEMTAGHVLRPGYSYAAEFAFGLELILDGLERART